MMSIIRELLDKKKSPLVMGIINCTSDSFYKASRKCSASEAAVTAEKMIAAGVDIIDIGAESTRPGWQPLSESDEIARIVPILKEVAEVVKGAGVAISVDTRKCSVAKAALEAGAVIINDVSALADDPCMAGFAAEACCDLVLMHWGHGGSSANHLSASAIGGDNIDSFYLGCSGAKNLWQELEEAISKAVEAGVKKENITVDIGIGFGKTAEENISLINQLAFFKEKGFPLLIGHSRKSFLGYITGKEVEERLASSLSTGFIAMMRGADILRVHDVGETADTVKVFKAFNYCSPD